jgi:hypothetical protein
MGLAELIAGLGSAVLDTGGRLSAAEARRLACDSCVIPMVLGSDSMPLDVGRQQRLATAALRDALAQRDKGCVFPRVTARPAIATRTTLCPGLMGARRSYPTCACCVSITMSWCTARDGASGSTPEGIPNSSHPRPWTPPEHHSTTHSGSEV